MTRPRRSLGALVILLGIATSVVTRAETFGAIAAGLVSSGSVVATRVAALAWRADDRLGLVVVGALSLVVLGNIAGFILVRLALTLVVPLPIGVLALHERVTTLALAGCGAVVAGLAVLLGKRAP